MGLPSKKQLHKHKRGTRKALDTLEAMEVDNDIQKVEPDVEDLIIKKKEKKHSEPQTPTESETEIIQSSAELDPSIPIADQPAQMDETEPVEESDEIETVDVDSTPLANEEENLSAESAESQEIEEQLPPEPSEKNPGNSEVAAVQQEPEMTETKEQQELNPEEKSSESQLKLEEVEEIETSEKPDDKEFEEGQEDTQKDKYLTFRIGDEIFGISIQYVTEIIVIQRITEVPDTPAFVKGVINLRGKVIPVIDIRQRFGLELRDYDERTCIVVVEHSETSVGMIVDTVNEVLDIPQQNVDPPPRSHSGIESTYLDGMGKIDNQVIIILELGKVLFVEELLRKKRDYEE